MIAQPPKPTFTRLHQALDNARLFDVFGTVVDVVGLVVETAGPTVRVGDLCIVDSGDQSLECEVVGFRGERALLSPLGELSGVRPGDKVRSTGAGLLAPYGAALKGRILDGLGRPLDNLGPLEAEGYAPTWNPAPNPVNRRIIDRPLATGVRAIDGLLTIGEGQRMGIFAGSGVGKSTLLGMIARSCEADVNVIALVGERGREVREFIENDLGPEGMKRSVVVCATSEQPAAVRIKAAMTATAIAEAFRDEGLRVLLMMDSVTRFAMAQREIGLATGEPPSTKGYTPSVFAMLPRLMERAGMAETGSITALYTVLVEGDDTNEPISDASRSILDGHIVLSRKLTSQGHYPPIDVMESVSRVMPMVTAKDQMARAVQTRELLAAYEEVADLINIGAYRAGANPLADRAIACRPQLLSFMRQDKADATDYATTLQRLQEILDA